MEILKQKLVIRDKTIERLKLELDEVNKLNEILENKLNEHTKLEPSPKKNTNGGRCVARIWGSSKAFRRCSHIAKEDCWCMLHFKKLQPSKENPSVLVNPLGIFGEEVPTYWGQYVCADADIPEKHTNTHRGKQDEIETLQLTEMDGSFQHMLDGSFNESNISDDIGEFVHNIHPDIGEFVHNLDSDILTNPEKSYDTDYINKIIKMHSGSIQSTFIYHSQPNILMNEQCLTLINYINTIKSNENDFKLNITKEKLIELIGDTIFNKLITIYEGFYNTLYIRRVIGDKSLINFHKDYSNRTMKIALNNQSEFEGGDLVYLTDGCFHKPDQLKGSITIHNNDIIHGVTPILSGIRYSLFILHTQ